jgi:hypothetical protein
VDYEKLNSDRLGEASASIQARVQTALNIQKNDIAQLILFATPEGLGSAVAVDNTLGIR